MPKFCFRGGIAQIKKMNPFVLLLIVIVVTLLSPGDSSLYSHLSNKREISALESERDKIKAEIEKDRRKLDELRFRKDRLEKYAREKYLMKAEDEDLYLLHLEE